MIEVTIVIPTFRRPALLARAVESCLAQDGIDPARCAILVVDNCPDGSARETVTALADGARIATIYAHEPRPGISHARNRGLAEARGDFAAFIDDDQTAAPHWLRTLMATQAAFDADTVLAPVLPDIAADLDPARLAFFRAFFTYAADCPTGTALGSGALTPFWARRTGPDVGRGEHGPGQGGARAYPRLASGNALLRLAAVRQVRFDPRLGLTGGEDTVFFNQLLADGARLVWCAEAIARETVPDERLTLAYVLPRAFRGGQITSRTPLLLKQPRPALTALSMAVGAAQLAANLPLALAATVLRAPGRFHRYAAIATALGKLLWMPPFRRRAYGAAAPAPGASARPSEGTAR